MTTLDRYHRIIQKPVLTEKATDDSGRRNAYHFKVPVETGTDPEGAPYAERFDVSYVPSAAFLADLLATPPAPPASKSLIVS